MSETKKKKLFNFKGERTASTIIIAIGITVFLLSVLFSLTPVYVLMLTLASSAATYEIIHATGCKNKLVLGSAIAASALTVLSVGFGITIPAMTLVLTIYVLYIMSLSVFMHSKGVKFMDSVVAIFASLVIAYAFSCFIRIYNIGTMFDGYTNYESFYLVSFAFSSCWGTDSYAYLVGKRIGKHKMSPVISPKKSVEGAIGGVVLCAITNAAILFVFTTIFNATAGVDLFGIGSIKYLYIMLISVPISLVSMVGDLTFSALKRNYQIKDFSNLLPGHGGIVDRFDSCIFAVPVLYAIFETISKLS